MSDLQNIEQPSWGGVASTPAERNKVMRNTYWLLALSLLPTVLGAWLGVATGITQSLGGGLGCASASCAASLHTTGLPDF